MQERTATSTNTQFAEDVHKGLTDFPKHLSSKYFYDERGDKLFQDIMNMPEYYLTDYEFDILTAQKKDIIRHFQEGGHSINLVELGAGDGKKTKILLRQLISEGIDFKYLPIDISQNALDSLEKSLRNEIPAINIETKQGTYFEVLHDLASLQIGKKVILFLGSNIGNLLHPEAVDFLQKLRGVMAEEDLLFIGFDQKKEPQKVLDAYNDPAGITAEFNKNVLLRINNELGGNFDLEKFRHWEVYDPETGTAKSYLISTEQQLVTIADLQLDILFRQWETIHTEISQKYDDEVVNWLAKESGLTVTEIFSSTDNGYKNYLFKKTR